MTVPQDMKGFLDRKVVIYQQPDFVKTDPVQIPALFSEKENKEIAGFLTATIAWGQRASIIRNAYRLVEGMDGNPLEFLMQTEPDDWQHLLGFKHRTFNGIDCLYFLAALKHIYRFHGGLEQVFTTGFQKEQSIFSALSYFRQVFFELEHQHRSRKHVSDVTTGASAKRLNMFLRWMVRTAAGGVDFGLWAGIPASALMLPLDVHTGRVARKLGLLNRRQNDWKAVEELSSRLREFDPADPVKYDFALFGLGVFEDF